MELLKALNLSNNHPNEELNPLCNLHSLRYLDLSNNQLAGLIPTCLGNFNGNLTLLNLRRNDFHGSIPQTFGYASMLQELDISHNGLQGVLPRSLANCTNLEILNLSHNFIEDAFPFRLENLPQLKVIVLRHNKFHGPIEQLRKRLAFTNLHIIDISYNDFTGPLPSKYFDSWDSMMMANEDKAQSKYIAIYDYYSVTIMNKRYEMEYVKILTIFKLVDFSHNKFYGKIPISVGRLTAVSVLNFSGNDFIGLIPLSLVNLTELESLDLSQNKLSGKIPQELTSLTFLEVFDVSQNNLTGIIPRGQQYETFSNTSYGGNAGLCGFPLSKECKTPKEAVLMGYGCGTVFGLVIGSCIIRRKEEWLARIFRVKMRHQKKRSNVVRFSLDPDMPERSLQCHLKQINNSVSSTYLFPQFIFYSFFMDLPSHHAIMEWANSWVQPDPSDYPGLLNFYIWPEYLTRLSLWALMLIRQRFLAWASILHGPIDMTSLKNRLITKSNSIVRDPNVAVEFTRQIFPSEVQQSMANRGDYEVFREGIHGAIKGLYSSYEIGMHLRAASKEFVHKNGWIRNLERRLKEAEEKVKNEV
ncbi:hypothetical protein TEA_015834 [Camellia sinensis var. sinensis]|uniref:Uncharacterized protein n=1 Tax=Camellia sinensis var. sinensis TaxID=542762 RepID=A0A4S4DG84_CAMSN|nr:hypothetical protein TEA_015834 [Camellia sinensis var. sinensis]